MNEQTKEDKIKDLEHRIAKEIKEYSEKEIKKIVKYLSKKYKDYDVENVIRMNTDPDYWY